MAALRYHRHFMLSEFLNGLDIPGGQSKSLEAYCGSYAAHLAKEYHAKEVTLTMRRHRLPTMAEVQAGTKLSDASLYEDKVLGTFSED